MRTDPAIHKKDQPLVAYLDHQVWCGMAANEPKYFELRRLVEVFAKNINVVIPYSLVHIQELTEVGKTTEMSRSNRLQKVMPKLAFIKEISRSILLETNADYSSFFLNQRDPIEAFETFTEVELPSVATHYFTDFIPKTMVLEIQGYFNVGAKKLNSLNEAAAIERINLGFKKFIEKCDLDRDFYRVFIDESKEQAEKMVVRGYEQSLAVIAEAKQFILQKVAEIQFSEAERLAIQSELSKLEEQKACVEKQLPIQIEAVQKSCEKSYTSSIPTYSFEMLVNQMATLEQTKNIPADLRRTLLLDFFGYESKLNNRRSDYYDALHRQYAKVCNCFVTEDTKLQKKLGVLNSQIAGTKCQLLDPQGFEQVIRRVLGDL